MNVDPVEMRELATSLRWQAGIVESHQPLAKATRDAAREGTDKSQTFARVQETLEALDKVVRYHADRMRAVANEIDTAATEYEAKDSANAKSIEQAGPR
ncbi:type VII secretion target [Nocardia noduli]|uniref:type VII secretion target n=1 Tax=Nocardia noduli TaxID=2815722 RepID=UPI001C247647|nr:type VII secretion target [Nocardia noduli]